MARVVDPIFVIRHPECLETDVEVRPSSDQKTSTNKKLCICLHYFIKSLRIISLMIVAIILISNPISFLTVAIIHWNSHFNKHLPQLMIVWSFIHFVIYLKLIYLKIKNKFTVEYLISEVQILLNFCIIVWFIVFLLLVVILSNGMPDDFDKLLMYYLFFNIILSFILFGIPCILLISPVICDSS